MGFSIDATNLKWQDGVKEDEDMCLHGHAIACIGEHKLEYDATISATALYLLKSLTEDHKIYDDCQMLPCCGFTLLADDTLDNVTVLSCPYGIDWSVIHDGNTVILELDDGTRECVSFDDYRKEVLAFADKVEGFYISCAPKKLPKDEFDRNGYIAFWNEWHRRKKS